jgi:hypothetical protein
MNTNKMLKFEEHLEEDGKYEKRVVRLGRKIELHLVPQSDLCDGTCCNLASLGYQMISVIQEISIGCWLNQITVLTDVLVHSVAWGSRPSGMVSPSTN